jgi:hypothetical protein
MFLHNSQVEKVHKPPLLPYSCGKEIKVYAYGTGKSKIWEKHTTVNN